MCLGKGVVGVDVVTLEVAVSDDGKEKAEVSGCDSGGKGIDVVGAPLLGEAFGDDAAF